MSDAPKNPAALATVQTAAVRRTGIARVLFGRFEDDALGDDELDTPA